MHGAGEWCEVRRVFGMYVHDLNPVLVRFTDQIQLRWYGLAYLGAFVVGAWLLNILAKRKLWVLPAGAAGDFIAAAAIFGVFIGGRLGYMLWYYPDQHGWGWVTEDPLMLLRVWEGGMASHGGILGLLIFTWVYAKKKGVSWRGLGRRPLRGIAAGAAVRAGGEFHQWRALRPAGRGRGVGGEVPAGACWSRKKQRAWIFPRRCRRRRMRRIGCGCRSRSGRTAKSERRCSFRTDAGGPAGDDAVTKAIEPFLLPRHPSQLYEGLLEGALLFAILWWVRTRFPQAPVGILTGLFFVLYAVFRIFAEQFREPDSELVLKGMMTSGQFLSLFMVAVGLGFLVAAKLMPGKVKMES